MNVTQSMLDDMLEVSYHNRDMISFISCFNDFEIKPDFSKKSNFYIEDAVEYNRLEELIILWEEYYKIKDEEDAMPISALAMNLLSIAIQHENIESVKFILNNKKICENIDFGQFSLYRSLKNEEIFFLILDNFPLLSDYKTALSVILKKMGQDKDVELQENIKSYVLNKKLLSPEDMREIETYILNDAYRFLKKDIFYHYLDKQKNNISALTKVFLDNSGVECFDLTNKIIEVLDSEDKNWLKNSDSVKDAMISALISNKVNADLISARYEFSIEEKDYILNTVYLKNNKASFEYLLIDCEFMLPDALINVHKDKKSEEYNDIDKFLNIWLLKEKLNDRLTTSEINPKKIKV